MMKLIKGIFSIATFVVALGFMNNSAMAATNNGDSLTDVYSYIGSELKNRPTYIEVEVKNFEATDIADITGSKGLQSYTEEDGTYYDYEVYNINSLRYTTKTVNTDGQTSYIVKLYPTYKESKKETNYVFSKVKEILSNNSRVNGLSDTEKYEWIYNYIINNVTYDTTMNNITAYAALTKGTTICGGYSSLYYAFATQLGLNCRIAYGTGYGVYHAWNLVELDGSWYCVDSTMGDNPGYSSSFFLGAMNNLSSHVLENGFAKTLSLSLVDYNYAF